MGLVLRPIGPSVPGDHAAHLRSAIVIVTFDSSLAAGGEAGISAVNLGWTEILGVVEIGADAPVGYVFKWDKDGEKITAFQSQAYTATTVAAGVLTEASTADISTTPVKFLVLGV